MQGETPGSPNCHNAVIVWLTGVPAAGKTTIAIEVARRLSTSGGMPVILDGDQLRAGVCADLGFSEADRIENVRRVGELASLLYRQGMIVLCALVSPYRASRDRVRALVPAGRFLEVHVMADLDTCRARDPKGLYAKADQGKLDALTGVSATYEPPLAPELTIDTRHIRPAAAGDLVMDLLRTRGVA